MSFMKACMLLFIAAGICLSDVTIGDLESGTGESPYGGWYYFDDVSNGGSSEILSHFRTTPGGIKLDSAFNDPDSGYCAILDYFLGESDLSMPPRYSYVGVGMELLDTVDITGGTFVSFSIKADKETFLEFQVKMGTVKDEAHFGFDITASDTGWQTIYVKLDPEVLKQAYWGKPAEFDLTKVHGFNWIVRSEYNNFELDGETGQIYIDNLTIVGNPAAYESLATPVLLSPENDEQWATINNLKLIWNRPAGAKTFAVKLSNQSDFSSSLIDTTGWPDTSAIIPGLDPETQYYWLVRAENNYDTSEWSDTAKFRTATIPVAPVLISPDSDSVLTTLTPNLSWESAEGAESYTIELSESVSFLSFVLKEEVTKTTYTLPALEGEKTFYWRVRASNIVGDGPYSYIWNFSTPNLPAAPQFLTPENNAVGVLQPVSISWKDVPEVSMYNLQISTNADFSSGIIKDTNLADTTIQISGLTYNRLFYLRVAGKNSEGTGPWSDIRNFTTQIAPPSVPVLNSPGDNSTGIPLTVTLRWNSVSGATGYTMQLSKKNDFSSVVLFGDIATTSTEVSGLEVSAVYYWRIRAFNAGGNSSWATRSFTTISPPSAPILANPANSAVINAFSTTLKWKKIAGSIYVISLSKDSLFVNSPIVDTVSDTIFNTPSLDNNATYYWHVAAINEAGQGSFSARRMFKVSVLPGTPALASPANLATNVTKTAELSWGAVVNAVSYNIQISTVEDFSHDTILDTSFITSTSIICSNLKDNTTYYWRVRTENEAGNGPWTLPWSFTTILPVPNTPALVLISDTIDVPTFTCVWHKTGLMTTKYQIMVFRDSLMTDTVLINSNLTDTTLILDSLKNDNTYRWKVRAYNSSGWGNFSDVAKIVVSIPVSVIPKTYALRFTGASILKNIISFDIPEQCKVSLVVYDMKGRVVNKSVSGIRSAGTYKVNIGNRAPGRYFLSFTAGNFKRVIPFVVN